MKSIVVIPFASKLHGEHYYSAVLEAVKNHIEKTGIKVEYAPIVSAEEEIDVLAKKYTNYIPIFVAITGGTSRLMYNFALTANYSRVVLLAHGEHNSLPSAISARSKMDLEGIWSWLYHCREFKSADCFLKIQQMARVVKAVNTILGSRILLVSPHDGKPENIENFETRFEARVDVMSIDEFISKLKDAKKDYVERFLNIFSKLESTISTDKLIDVGEVYAALRSIVETKGYTGVALDCFPYLSKYRVTPCLALALLNSESAITACEGDLSSLALMIISRALTGYSGWTANASAFESTRLYLSHCTIALNMSEKHKITSHFESGYPYALIGRVAHGVYTAVSLSPDFSVIVAGLGRVVGSGMIYETMCRTQVVLDLGIDAERVPLVAVANHHVLIPGDVREELKAVAALLGLDYVEYRDLVVSI